MTKFTVILGPEIISQSNTTRNYCHFKLDENSSEHYTMLQINLCIFQLSKYKVKFAKHGQLETNWNQKTELNYF